MSAAAAVVVAAVVAAVRVGRRVVKPRVMPKAKKAPKPRRKRVMRRKAKPSQPGMKPRPLRAPPRVRIVRAAEAAVVGVGAVRMARVSAWPRKPRRK